MLYRACFIHSPVHKNLAKARLPLWSAAEQQSGFHFTALYHQTPQG